MYVFRISYGNNVTFFVYGAASTMSYYLCVSEAVTEAGEAVTEAGEVVTKVGAAGTGMLGDLY